MEGKEEGIEEESLCDNGLPEVGLICLSFTKEIGKPGAWSLEPQASSGYKRDLLDEVHWFHMVPGIGLEVIPSTQDNVIACQRNDMKDGGNTPVLVNWKDMHVNYSKQNFGHKDLGLQIKDFRA